MLQPGERDPFLANPDKLHVTIKCVSCREDLWTQKILSRMGGRVGATETKPAQNGVPPFDERIKKCIFCQNPFFAVGKKGSQMYLLRDENCQITRLI
jgi:ubiquitin